MSFLKRKPEDRKKEAKKSKQVFNSNDIQGIRNKLGISSTAPKEKIIFELNKVRHKKDLLKSLKITDADLKEYGF
jgi:hypothetical protein